MFPGLGGNPRQMAELMRQLGMKSTDIDAKRVLIEKNDGTAIVVDSPQVVQIEMQGQKSFQVSGEVSEQQPAQESSKEKGQDDASIVMAQTGVSRQQAEAALQKSGGDIAQAILELGKG